MTNITATRRNSLVFVFVLLRSLTTCIEAGQTGQQSHKINPANNEEYQRHRRLDTAVPLLPPVDKDGNRIRKKYKYIAKDNSLEITAEYNDAEVAKEKDDMIPKKEHSKSSKKGDKSKDKKDEKKGTEKTQKRSSKGPKGERFSEKLRWKISVGTKGFLVETQYENHNNGTLIETSLMTSVSKLVEFVKDYPENDDEVFQGQHDVVFKRDLNKWQRAKFEGGCADDRLLEEACTVTFKTEDGCLTIVTTINLAQSISTDRLNVDIDDAKQLISV